MLMISSLMSKDLLSVHANDSKRCAVGPTQVFAYEACAALPPPRAQVAFQRRAAAVS